MVWWEYRASWSYYTWGSKFKLQSDIWRGDCKSLILFFLLLINDTCVWVISYQPTSLVAIFTRIYHHNHHVCHLLLHQRQTQRQHIQSRERTESTHQRQNHVSHIGWKSTNIKYRPKFPFDTVMTGRAGQGPNHRPQQEEWNKTATANVSMLMLNVFL